MSKSKSVFSFYNSARPIKAKTKDVGILSVAYCSKINNFVLGPKLKENSSKIDVAEKIRQIHSYYYIDSLYNNNEDLPLFPKYEKEILQFPFPSFVYSYYFMKSPWKEAEEVIAKDKVSSVLYAIKVLKSRFEPGENAMKEDPEICLAYCIRIMKRKILPKSMHQAMLLNSIKEGSKFTKRYLSYKGVINSMQ